ncbi:MAG: ATP-binding protein, partial [Bacteroidota bacterium]
PNSLSSNLIRQVHLDRQGVLWILTEDGLNRLTSDFYSEHLSFDRFLPGVNLYWIHEAKDGSFWLGTYGEGLIHWHPESGILHTLRVVDGLPGDIVFGVLADQDGNLWLSTNHGLALYHIERGELTTYDLADGLVNHEYDYNSAYQNSNGEMFFGGGSGFTSFFPHQLTTNDFVPSIAFTDFILNHQSVHPNADEGPLFQNINHTESITLAHNQANFSIEFSALNFLSPQHNQYTYRLDGLEEQWHGQKGKGRATYTIQKSGTYTFRVRAANNDGLWNPDERSITIVVLPPPWKSWWALLIYGIGVSATLLLLVRFNNIRHRLTMEQLEKEQQAKLHQTKLAFFTNIAHEFRTPLSLILSPLEELLHQQQTDSWVANRLRIMERNARQLYNLINQLLVFRQTESDHLQLKAKEGDLVSFTRDTLFAFEARAEQRQLSLHFFPQYPDLQVAFDPDKLEKVLVNLLSNAVKFTPDGGRIELHLSQDGEEVVIQVIDNGIGIPEEKQARIFDRFYEGELTSHNPTPGSGIGLAISKKLVELHEGTLSVQSGKGVGSTFVIRLPVSRESDRCAEGHPETPPDSQTAHRFFHPAPAPLSPTELMEEPLPSPTHHQPTILIVEDHVELRHYLQDLLGKEYRILEAESGEKGWDMAKEQLPDLVLSDVMMDQMDGIQLCQQIKGDLQTSHIPVLLLTAKAAQHHKNLGLSSGADDYVTKPFHPSELSLRVRNLILSRQQLRERFVRVLSLEPKEITVTSADEDFLNQMMLLTEEHIDDPNFRIESFAEGLGVSRSLLFSKLKALTGQTPNHFLQHLRLKRGMQLLQSGELNVSEVAYQVGFRDPKYFSKCFSKRLLLSLFFRCCFLHFQESSGIDAFTLGINLIVKICIEQIIAQATVLHVQDFLIVHGIIHVFLHFIIGQFIPQIAEVFDDAFPDAFFQFFAINIQILIFCLKFFDNQTPVDRLSKFSISRLNVFFCFVTLFIFEQPFFQEFVRQAHWIGFHQLLLNLVARVPFGRLFHVFYHGFPYRALEGVFIGWGIFEAHGRLNRREEFFIEFGFGHAIDLLDLEVGGFAFQTF